MSRRLLNCITLVGTILFTLSSTAWAAFEPWYADLNDPQRIAQAFRATYKVPSQSKWCRPFADLLDIAREFQTIHGLDEDHLRMSMTSVNFLYNPFRITVGPAPERLHTFKNHLRQMAIDVLPGNGAFKIHPPEKIVGLSYISPRVTRQLIALSPFLSGDITDRATVLAEIDQIDAGELEARYRQWVSETLVPILNEAVGSGDKDLFALQNYFYNQVYKSAFQHFRTIEWASKPEPIRITRMNPLMALHRGHLGGDCADQSVAFYALSRRADTFYVSGKDPGYIFVTRVKVSGGRELPYILTLVNGSGQGRTWALVRAVAHWYGTDEVLIPRSSALKHTVSDRVSRDALNLLHGQTIKVESWPEDWNAIRDFQARFGRMPMPDLYAIPKLSEPKLVPMTSLNFYGTLTFRPTSRPFTQWYVGGGGGEPNVLLPPMSQELAEPQPEDFRVLITAAQEMVEVRLQESAFPSELAELRHAVGRAIAHPTTEGVKWNVTLQKDLLALWAGSPLSAERLERLRMFASGAVAINHEQRLRLWEHLTQAPALVVRTARWLAETHRLTKRRNCEVRLLSRNLGG